MILEGIEFFNKQIYSDNSKTDQGGMYKGLGPYIFDEKFLFYHLIGTILIILGLFLSNKKIINA